MGRRGRTKAAARVRAAQRAGTRARSRHRDPGASLPTRRGWPVCVAWNDCSSLESSTQAQSSTCANVPGGSSVTERTEIMASSAARAPPASSTAMIPGGYGTAEGPQARPSASTAKPSVRSNGVGAERALRLQPTAFFAPSDARKAVIASVPPAAITSTQTLKARAGTAKSKGSARQSGKTPSRTATPARAALSSTELYSASSAENCCSGVSAARRAAMPLETSSIQTSICDSLRQISCADTEQTMNAHSIDSNCVPPLPKKN